MSEPDDMTRADLWWQRAKAEIEGQEMWCAPYQKRRRIAELLSVNGQEFLGRTYEVRDDRGERWEVQRLDDESAKAVNDGIPFVVVTEARKDRAKAMARQVAEYEYRQRQLPPRKPTLSTPGDHRILYHYWRHHAPGFYEVDSLEDALRIGESDREENEAMPDYVTQGDRVLHDFQDSAAPA